MISSSVPMDDAECNTALRSEGITDKAETILCLPKLERWISLEHHQLSERAPLDVSGKAHHDAQPGVVQQSDRGGVFGLAHRSSSGVWSGSPLQGV